MKLECTKKINSLNFNTLLKINKETSDCMLEEGNL